METICGSAKHGHSGFSLNRRKGLVSKGLVSASLGWERCWYCTGKYERLSLRSSRRAWKA